MIEKIISIKQALESECYLPALALALTLPDICGQIEYPDYLNDKGKRLVGKQYVAWFDNWVDHRYADPSGWMKDRNRAKNPYFTGKMCYALRCSFLHSGNTDHEDLGKREDEQNRYSFELCVNGCDMVGFTVEKHLQRNIENIRIDINALCNNLCLSAEEYYQHKGKEVFNDHVIKILDIQAYSNKLITHLPPL